MKVRPLPRPLAGEHVVAVRPLPTLKPRLAAAEWLRRLNFFTGRTLTDTAFQTEQAERAGRLATLGQALSAGTVTGLAADLEPPTGGAGAVVAIAPGLGLLVSGEDVVIHRPVRVPLADVPLLPLATNPPNDPNGRLQTFSDLPPAPLAGVLVLQPIVAEEDRPGPDDGCDPDPRDAAFEDRLIADGCRLLFHPWPAAWGALPAPGADWRNRLAYAVFEREADLLPAEVLPWELAGLPVGLVGQAAGGALFLDRAAVVREGGKPKRRTPVVAGTGNPFLWQARIQQFAEQLAEVDTGALPPERLGEAFRYLPPVGLLPRSAADPLAQRFFPGSFEVECVPVPREQLDAVVAASAALAPFDTGAADQVRIVFPVPQVWYEPDLLRTETVDAEFQAAVNDLVTARGVWLQRRDVVRKRAARVAQALTGEPLVYPDPDPAALEPKEAVGAGPLDPPEGTGLGPTGNESQEEIRKKLHQDVVALKALSPEEVKRLDGGGLVPFLAELEGKTSRANDVIDLNFLRIHTDIYRIRQLVLGNTTGTRLATSPALAEIAQGQSAVATREDIGAFLLAAKAKIPKETTLVRPTDFAAAEPGPARFVAGEFGAAAARATVAATATDVVEKNPIVGEAYNFRTLSIADRVATPKSPEAKSFAVSTKYDVIKGLSGLDLHITDVTVPGFLKNPQDPRSERSANFDEIIGKHLADQILEKLHDPDPANGDEGAFFSAGVRSLDHAVAALRAVEARIQAYRRAAALVRTAVAALTAVAADIDRRLKVIGDELAEARHDVSVARALLAEEQGRVDAVNDRRRQILADHVPFLVFHRPRAIDLSVAPPVRPLDPAEVVAPVPACLARELPVPADLRALVNLYREAPVKWFPGVTPIILRLDRLDVLVSTIQSAKVRAATQFTALQLAAPPAPVGLLGAAVARTLAGQRSAAEQFRLQTSQFDLGEVANRNWAHVQETAQGVVSLGDLIDGAHGRTVVAQRAAQELEHVTRVSACLYTALCGTPARLRLGWAERVSQFDAAVSLRDLTALPRWGEVPVPDRREMQAHVDWLFGRVDTRQPNAVALMNDLVRVCVLLASHAPVTQIIAGHVPRRTPIHLGALVDLVIDPNRIRIGMHVLMYAADRVVARGVVDDLATDRASARVVQLATGALELAEGSRVQFAEPETFDRPLTSAVTTRAGAG